MTKLLRWIRKTTRPPKDTDFGWVPSGEYQAHPLGYLAADDNVWSVFQVDDDQDKINRVVAALAGGRDKEAIAEYVIFDDGLVGQAGLPKEQTPGKTGDALVDSWHWDIVHITATRLATLVTLILLQTDIAVRGARDVTRLVARSIANEYLPRRRVNYAGDSRNILEDELRQLQAPDAD